jgi:hypothetical protein
LQREKTKVINNRKAIKCERCGKPAQFTVHADGFDDAPANFTATEECDGGCKKRYYPMSAQQMHDLTGLPLAGWSEARF